MRLVETIEYVATLAAPRATSKTSATAASKRARSDT
jgi:hypothetical protein